MRGIARFFYRICSTIFLDRVNLTLPVRRNRKWLKIPTFGRVGYSNLLSMDLWMIDLLKKLLPLKEGAFIDVGVNVGQTLLKVKCVNSENRYVGFEPNPTCVYYVRTLIRKNGFKSCELVPVGLSNENGIATLESYSGETDSAATIIPRFREQQVENRVLVPVERFEYVLDKLDIENISVIKIDVEGGELEVIQGLGRFLDNVRPFILCEILPVYSTDNTFRESRQQEVEIIMKAHRYGIYRIEKNKKGHLLGLTHIDTIGIHSDLSLVDYLFIPNELADCVVL